MDIYDFAVVQPRRQELLTKCDFSKLKAPHDTKATEIGNRWYTSSGGEQIATDAKAIYSDYLRDTISISDVDRDQIAKDLKRTSITSFYQATYKQWFSTMDKAFTTEQVSRILTAFVRRNPVPGYAQGMDYIVFLLLSLQSEEHAFWTLCGMMETLIPR